MTPAELSSAVVSAVHAAVEAGELTVPVPGTAAVERPRNKEHGDYATNIALRLAKPAGQPPRQVAEIVAARLRHAPGVEAVDVAGPGFLNITLRSGAQGQLVRTIVLAGEEYGRNDVLNKLRINLEFVSANPTGPIHIGGVRWAAVGDSLARILRASGADVATEYYINDAGVQVDKFAASLHAVAQGRPAPEDGYVGAYIDDIARRILDAHPGLLDRPEDEQLGTFRETGLELMKAEIRHSLESFGVYYDVWFSERTLHSSGAVDRAVGRLREQGHVFDADGAVWLRTTDFGDDRDRVLVRGNGEKTYFASDAAYYLDKRDRGFEVNAYMLGADHHGYIGRLKAIVACAGDDPDHNIEVLIGQFVKMVRDGEEVRLSKRAGNIITLGDVVEMLGVDAARYALARSSTDSVLVLDVDLLTSARRDNPVYYVQYVAARTASVSRNAHDLGLDRGAPRDFGAELLTHEKEGELLGALAEFPGVVATAGELREPHRVARYLEQLAGTYHRFYDECRILPRGDEEINDLMRARLWLNDATRTVIANGLGLLGVTAPERM